MEEPLRSPKDESFITKKMEEMKRRNEEILRRHMEIEQDKMLADQFSSTAKTQRKDVKVERNVSSNAARSHRNRPPVNERHTFQSKSDGPPPDPNFNFLSDPSRKRTESQSSEDNWRDTTKSNSTWSQSRRHHTNYRGSDFKNVKSTMQKHKSSFKKDLAEAPQRAGNLAIQMTGRERIQYEEWKKERDKVDQERIQRQRTSDGAWRREWDSHKALEFNFSNNQHNLEMDELCEAFQRQHLKPKRSVPRSDATQPPQRSEIRSGPDDSETAPDLPARECPRIISREGGKLNITLQNQPKQETVKEEILASSTQPIKDRPQKRSFSEDKGGKTSSHNWTFLKPNIGDWMKPEENDLKDFLKPWKLLRSESVEEEKSLGSGANAALESNSFLRPRVHRKPSKTAGLKGPSCSWTSLKPEFPQEVDIRSQFSVIRDWQSKILQKNVCNEEETELPLGTDVDVPKSIDRSQQKDTALKEGQNEYADNVTEYHKSKLDNLKNESEYEVVLHKVMPNDMQTNSLVLVKSYDLPDNTTENKFENIAVNSKPWIYANDIYYSDDSTDENV